MAHCDRLKARETGLQQATLIVGAGLRVAALVAKMDFDPCKLFAEVFQGAAQ
jgi:hypothetical protein